MALSGAGVAILMEHYICQRSGGHAENRAYSKVNRFFYLAT